MKSLGHLRVLDLTRVLAGPWCTQLLADLGAEVIKIERPRSGDDTRHWGPPYLKDATGNETSESAYYLSANRGKQSVTLDISTTDGQELVRKLAAQCDVVVENYKVGQLSKYGLGYAALAAINPKLIYCSITGFGQTGPHRNRPGYDFIMQGVGGFMSITGERDDRPGGGPQKAGVAVSDLMTGMYSTVAILAAVTHRDRTGEGQYIDMALYDVMIAMLANMNMNYLTSGKAPQRAGNAHANIVPYQVFAAADGHIVVTVGNDSQFIKFCEVAGVPRLAADARYRRNADRVRNREALIAALDPILRARPVASWVEQLDAAGVPCGPINDIAHALADPQVAARGLRIDLAHALAGTVPMVANPIKLSATPPVYELPPPMLGEHTASVLRTYAGVDEAQLSELMSRGVV
ncbi:MAG: CoA transferase [Burkholderiaceae bacterium]|nr:CoA transferase [Burkholderiaceae bacterium]